MKPKAILFLILLFTIISCTSEIDVAKCIDSGLPMTLKINTEKNGLTETKTKIIEPQSEKFKKFIVWCNSNSSGWKNAIASYNTNMLVTQNNFRLLYFGNAVVIGFYDEYGKPKQYSKSVKRGELDFLFKDYK